MRIYFFYILKRFMKTLKKSKHKPIALLKMHNLLLIMSNYKLVYLGVSMR